MLCGTTLYFRYVLAPYRSCSGCYAWQRSSDPVEDLDLDLDLNLIRLQAHSLECFLSTSILSQGALA